MKKLLVLSLIFLVGCGKDVSESVKLNPSNPIPPTSPHHQINKTLPANGNAGDRFVVTNDSSKIVYISDENTDGIDELMVANIDGSNRIKVSAPLSLGENVTRFLVAPNSQKVAYIADQTDGFFNLYTVNLDGTSHAQVNPGVNTVNHSIGHFLWMPNSSKIVYTSDETKPVGSYALYIANPDGTGTLTLNAGPVGQIFDVAPNNSRVVYREGIANPNLRSITPTGTNDILLNNPFDLGARPSSGVSNFVISPNSSLVAYRSNQDDNQKYELFVVNADGSGGVLGRVKVSGALVTGGNVSLNPKENYNFTPDSANVVYMADQEVDNKTELYISTVAGANTKLSGVMIAAGDIVSFKSSGSKTLFLADRDINGVNELFVVDNSGTNLIKVNSDLVAGENVGYYSTDNNKISYLMDMGSAGVYSAFMNNFDGASEVELVTINGGLGTYDPASAFAQQIVMQNSKIYFRAAINNSTYNLYYFNINSNTLEMVNETPGNLLLANDSLGSSFLVAPNGNYAVYRKLMTDGNNLFSSEID